MFDFTMPNAFDTKADRIYKTEDDKYLAQTMFYIGPSKSDICIYVDKSLTTQADSRDIVKAVRNGTITLVETTDDEEDVCMYRPVYVNYSPESFHDEAGNLIERFWYQITIMKVGASAKEVEYRFFLSTATVVPRQ